jgi:hypothetical protein
MRAASFTALVVLLLGCAAGDERTSDSPTMTPTPATASPPPPADEAMALDPPPALEPSLMNELGVAPAFETPPLGVVPPPPSGPREVEFHLLYVHGVQNCADDRRNADGALDELRAAVDEELPSRIEEFETRHSDVVLGVTSAHANLYTATPSGFQPSDSLDPLAMDDWEAGDPGCAAKQQGEPCTTAFEWRFRLVQEIERNFGPDAQNIILIAHSTGARTAFEVTANVGSTGLTSYNWGVQSRILGVVSLHGMVDALDGDDYQPTAPASFEASCKFGDLITGFGSNCAHGNGWCEYAAQRSAREAADWVARQKHALVLSSFASCSPSLFRGATDGPLPILAQASALSTGLRLVPSQGQTLAAASGEDYGSYCHSAITSPSVEGHAAAVAEARTRLLDWLFVSARRVRATGVTELEATAFQQTSSPLGIDGECDAEPPLSDVDIVGVCEHPGLFDGDDHAISEDEWLPADDANCPGRLIWSQLHDPDEAHTARVTWKTYAEPERGGALESLAR